MSPTRTRADRRIALVTDNPYRDLPGLVLLARRLAQAGGSCWLVPNAGLWGELGAIAPDLTVLNNLRRQRHELASALMNAGSQVAVLETEGGVMPDFETYTALARPDRALFARVSRVCTWGPRVADFVVSDGWFSKAQVVVTGSPRFDFYAPAWRDAALRASTDIQGMCTPPLILVVGSFPRGNPVVLNPTSAPPSATPGAGSARGEQVREVEREAMLGMIEVANHLAARFPEATVVYRPHPFEHMPTYESRLQSRPNLRLLKVGSVEGWILRATVLVHRNSTTAIEAAMCGVPALLPGWLPVAETLEACDAVSVRCADVDALDAQVTSALEGRWQADAELTRDASRVIADWFHQIDGQAHERVAGALLPLLEAPRAVDGQRFRDMYFWGWPPSTLSRRSRISARLRQWLGVPPTWSFSERRHVDPCAWWPTSDKFFDATVVERMLKWIDPDEGTVRARQAERTDYVSTRPIMRSVIVEPVS